MTRKEIEKYIYKSGEYYSLQRIKNTNSYYNIIFGERSNGKSFAVELEGILNYWFNKETMCIIRRYDTDFSRKSGVDKVFDHFVNNNKLGNLIELITNREWNDIVYYSGGWYLCTYSEKGIRIKDNKPFCNAFAINNCEHYKSTSYPTITTILFDEFMTRDFYLPDEFISFTNILSTIIRDRENVKIYMCGNTVNKYNPYFKEMGLDNVLKMNIGDLDIYQFAAYKDKVLSISVEYADNPRKEGKPSDVYFAFKNPKLKMITNGVWEIALYPHLPFDYKNQDINGIYFICWEDTILQCEIIQKEDAYITYIHKKTTPLKDIDNDLIFKVDYDYRPNCRRNILKPMDEISKKIAYFYKYEKVFYQDNEIGEVVRNYLMWCRTNSGVI